MSLNAQDLRRRLWIIFPGEEGLDYGGVSRLVMRSLRIHSIELLLGCCCHFYLCICWISHPTLTSALSSPHSQGVVLPAVPWSPESHVLPVWVCWQEQLLSADQPSILHKPRPPHVLSLHRSLHRYGELYWNRTKTQFFCYIWAIFFHLIATYGNIVSRCV